MWVWLLLVLLVAVVGDPVGGHQPHLPTLGLAVVGQAGVVVAVAGTAGLSAVTAVGWERTCTGQKFSIAGQLKKPLDLV